MTARTPIIGAGGGKGGSGSARSAVEAPDSLRSKAFAQIIDLISEGEIQGLVNGAQSVYLDSTPLQNADGSYNFTGVELTARNGTQSQSYIPGFPAVESSGAVGVEVTTTTSVTRQITDTNTNAVRVTIGIPQLTSQNTSNGDINGTSVQIAIDVQSNGAGFVTQILGQTWGDDNVATIDTGWFRATAGDTCAIRITCTDYIAPATYRIEYRQVGSSTWLTTGTYTSTASGAFSWVTGPSGTVTYFTPTLAAGTWEARIVKISDGSTPPTSYTKTWGSRSQTVPITYSAQRLYGSPYDTISGKTTSRYQRSYEIALPPGGAPWDIRVRRITADSTAVALQNKTYWDTYTQVVYAKMRYPNSALAALKIDSAQFTNIPTRGYDVKLLRVQVPTNYDPDTRNYSGAWDGTFKIAWTDNPAWCFYDLLTNSRYGLGALVDSTKVDKWAIYTIGKYCDTLVPDGFGGYEPRFTCNLYLQTRADAYKVLQDFASVFRGMVYWSTGSVTAVQDAPADPVALFSQANVIDGKFAYSGSSLKARHTVALVTWNDPDDMYRQKVEYVEDTAGIARYGVNQTEVAAIGCTSRGQANRVGRWLLYSERNETETVQFSVGLDGAVVRPGHIIKVADSARAAARMGGRVSASTTTAITLDKAPPSNPTGWTIYCVLPTGAVESRTVSSYAGSVVNVSSAFSAAPTPQGIYVMSSNAVQAQTFRVLVVGEDSETGNYTITALKHEPLKFDAVENGLVLQPRSITTLSAKPSPPSNGDVSEFLYEAATDVKTMVDVSWTPPDDGVFGNTVRYSVKWRRDAGNFVEMPDTSIPGIRIQDAQPGEYTFQVCTIAALGSKSVPYTFTATIYGKTTPPADVTDLQLAVSGQNAMLSWDLHPDLDVRIGGRIQIRYSSASSGAAWNTSIPVGDFAGNATNGQVALLSGTYLARAVDSSGNYSTGSTSVITNAPSLLAYNVVVTQAEQPAWNGMTVFWDDIPDFDAYTAAIDTQQNNGLELVGTELHLAQVIQWDDIVDLDAYTDYVDNTTVASGLYTSRDPIDIGQVYTCRVTADLDVVSYSVFNVVDTWTSVDGVTNIDGILDGADAFVRLYVRTTSDDPASSTATWSDWRPFMVGDYTARGYQFQLEVERGESPTQQVSVRRMEITIDVPDRVEGANNVLVPAVGMSVTFNRAFYVTPAIALTAENLATGDYAEVTAKSRSGFTIQFKNSAGTGVARTMDWIAKGFGFTS